MQQLVVVTPPVLVPVLVTVVSTELCSYEVTHCAACAEVCW